MKNKVVPVVLALTLAATGTAQPKDPAETAARFARLLGWEWQEPIEIRRHEMGVRLQSSSSRSESVSLDPDGNLVSASRYREHYPSSKEPLRFTTQEQFVQLAEGVLQKLNVSGLRLSEMRLPSDPKVANSVGRGIGTVRYTDAPPGAKIVPGAGNMVSLDFEAVSGDLIDVRYATGWTYAPPTPTLTVAQAKARVLEYLKKDGVRAKLKEIECTPEPSYILATQRGLETPAGARLRTRKQTALAYSLSFRWSTQLTVDAHTGEVLQKDEVKSEPVPAGESQFTPKSEPIPVEPKSEPVKNEVESLPTETFVVEVEEVRVIGWEVPVAVGAGALGIALIGWGIRSRRLRNIE